MADLKAEDCYSPLYAMPANASNEWDNAFVQSIETPYGASIYRERAEMLIKEVKIMLNEMKNGDGDGDLIEGLEMVDAIQCLGIDRYFESEIKVILDYVYRCWNGRVGIGSGSASVVSDLNATALGLRILRLHYYDVSADVLENFKDKNGEFFCSRENCNGNNNNSNMREEHMMRSMLNLLRASSISFPGEKVMDESKVFSTAYLKQILAKLGGTNISQYHQRFLKEVEYAQVYEWPCTFSRWEARNFIEIYEQDNTRFLSNLNSKKILELAKLQFNILQSIHQMEMKVLSRWWIDSGIPKLIAIRERSIEFFLWGVSGADEVEFSSSRLAVAKLTSVIAGLDDLFDDYATLDQLKLISEAVIQGWNVSIIETIPNNFKAIILFFFKTVHELASEVAERQGRDMMPHITKAWADYVTANLQKAQWRKSRFVPNFKDYIKNATIGSGMGPIFLQSILLAPIVLADDIIEKIYLNQSRFYELMFLCIRLTDDVADYEDEKLHGQTASAISSYMEDHLECKEDEAKNHINSLIELSLKELRWEFLNLNNGLLDCEKFCFNISKGIQFFYIFGDGLTYSDKETKHHIFKVLVEPVDI